MASGNNPTVVGGAAKTWSEAAERSAKGSHGSAGGGRMSTDSGMMLGELEQAIRDNPVRALIGAFATGWILTRLL